MTPGVLRNATSTPQKQPAPNIAFLYIRLSSRFDDSRGDECP
jgi:hypothetical protein